MADAKKATRRRSVSKPRLYKELEATMIEHDMGADASIGMLLEAIKEDGWREQMDK